MNIVKVLIKIVLTIICLGMGVFCIYGLTGMNFTEEKPPKARQVGALLSYIVVVGFWVWLIRSITVM
jgi:hypothetical protein